MRARITTLSLGLLFTASYAAPPAAALCDRRVTHEVTHPNRVLGWDRLASIELA